MSAERLHQDLAELRRELDQLPADTPARAHLLTLVRRIESQIDASRESEDGETLMQGVRDAATEFEVEHPRAAGLLQRIVQTLSSMGV